MAKQVEHEVAYYYDFHPTDDPNEPRIGRETARRLFGWQLDQTRRAMREMPVGPGGRLWSPQLDNFLVPDAEFLRLYDRTGQRRLTQAEAEAEARKAEARRAEALAEKLRSLGIDPDQI